MIALPTGMQAQLPGDCASPKTSPVAGTATVDLNYTEWSLANDFYACMYRAGNSTKPLLSKTYMRHDCSNDRVYVLVLVESGVTADMSPGDAWVRVPAIAGNSVVVSGSNQPAGTAFSWVYDNGNSATGTLMGFEAYFTQTSPFSDDIEVHLNTDGGETSSTGKISQNNAIPFSLACGTACIINIDKIIASGCSGGDHDLDVRVNYNNAPPGSDIEIVINSTDVYTFTPTGGADGCQIFAVSDISCSGALTVEARFKTNTGCSDMVSYTPMSPPTDPQGFIYCEEIGEIIAGGTIEVVVPNAGTVIQVHANGSSGEYAWDVLSGPVGEFSMLYNPPTGYALSTLHTPTPGTIDLTTYNGGSDIFLGQDANAAGTALVGFNPTTYQGDNPFYLNFSIDYGDPNLFLNNIPLSGCPPPVCPTCATIPDKNTTGFEWLSGCDDPATFTQTKNMTGNATWDDGNTSFLGFKPSEFYNGNVIKINGNGNTLTIPNSNLIIDGDGRSSTEWPYLVMENLTLEIENGNFQMIKGARVIMRNCTLRVSGDIQQQSAALHSQPGSWLCITGGYVECGDEQADGYFVGGATSPTSANWQNDNGKRYLNQVCFNVTQDFQQTTNTYTEDLHVSVCAEIGDQGPQHTGTDPFDGVDGGTGESGNMDITDIYTTYSSTYHITSGNFSFGSDSDSKICDAHYKTNDGYWDLDGGDMTGCTMCVWARDEDGSGGQFIEQSGSTYTIPDNTVTWRATNATNSELPGGLTTATQASLVDIQACMPTCCVGTAACAVTLDKVIATACSGTTSTHNASVKVTYAFAPAGEDIEIVVNGVATSFTPAGTSGTETFNVSGISCAGLVTVTARFETTTACSDVLTYTPSPNPPIDPQGFIYCEETGEIIAGGTIEVVAPNNGTVVQINLDGSNGEYDWDVIAGPGGDFNMIYNPPTGYALSTLHTASAGPLDITTANGGSDIYLGQDENGGGTALLGFNAGTYQADNPYYTSFNIDVGDPDLFLNNIPLSGCPPPGCTTFFNNPSIASAFNPLTIPCGNAANENDEDICATAPATTFTTSNCNSTIAPAHSLWMKFVISQNAPSFEMQFLLSGSVVPNVYYELYHSTVAGTDNPASLTPYIPNGSATQECGTNYTGWTTFNSPSIVSGGDVYVYMHIYTTVVTLGSDVNLNVKIRNSCPLPLCTMTTTAGATNPTCNGGSDGTATASPSGGAAPYTYSWSDGQTTQTATGLSDGTYTVTVTDAANCTASASATVNEPPPATTTAGSNSPVCEGSPINLTSGNGASHSWTSTTGFTSSAQNPNIASATGADAGTYTVEVTNASGCTATASTVVTVNPTPDLSVTSPITNVCPIQTVDLTNTAVTGLVDNNATGGTITYHTVPNPANGTANTVATPAAAATGTTYWIRSETVNGCVDIVPIVVTTTPCYGYAIGNMVFNDNGPCTTGEGNNGQYDAGSESGINGVIVRLFRDNNSNGLPDGPFIASDVTANGGFYLFDGLDAGNYLVHVDASNFAPAGPLNGLQSSTFTEANPNDDIDNNDNGRNTAFAGGIWSGTITLGPTEPVNESPLEPVVGQGANPDNQANMTVDFGFAAPASIGDYVWNDVDNNGLQGSTALEPPVQGVRVMLFRFTPLSLAYEGTQFTNASGNYLFDNLPGCRQYFLVFANLPTDYEFTQQDQTVNDNIDSDPNKLSGATVPTMLDPGENDMSWDAGIFLPKASLGDYVWDDLDEDGYQEAGEPPVPGVQVVLFNCLGDSLNVDVTDANGRYGFTDLVPGDYFVEFRNLPADYVFTQKDAGTWTTDSHDSDADQTTGRTACTHLDPYENDLNWDAGIYLPKASLGDKVWEDVDEDGEQDPNEPGVPNVKVVLYTCNGDSVTETTTNGMGYYLFDKLMPGSYYVVFSDIPQNYTFSPQDNAADGVDSDADATGKTACTTLDPGEDERDVDAGVHLHRASIGDRVWHDLNENGIQDAGEPGVPGVLVVLKKIGGSSWLDTTQTGPQGYYYFDDLVPGDYCLFFYQIPTDYVASPQNQGSNGAIDSDPNPTTFKTVTTTLDPGEDDPTWDLGIYLPKASLGDKVWKDGNENGIQDALESGVPNIRVVLYTCNGDSVDQDMTDSNGEYWFTDLDPGDYYVVFKDLPTGYVFSPKDAATFDSEDSDANSAGQSHCTNLSPGEVDPTVDAGIYLPKASLGDCVWNDANENGIQDPGESPVAGVTVTLYNGAGVQQGVQTTNLFGKYLFDNLVPGDYYVVFTTLPPDYEFTQQDAGSDNEKDSDADPNTGKTMTTTLDPGENDLSWDAGIYLPKATLGNKVWNDDNENGVQDPGETGVSGITVKLYDCSGTYVATTTTNADGEYWFTDLIPGSYYVEFSNLPTDYIFSPANSTTDANDSDANSAGQTACVSLAPGETNPTVDAGIYLPKAKLGDKVFEDGNNNGIQDPGESGVLGVKVTLYDCAGNYQADTYTDINGEYLFDNLMPGSYYVVFSDLPFNYAFSIKDAGTNDHVDSDADASGQTACVSLAAGETNLSVDAGIYTIGGPGPIGELGNRVWDDVDEDGEQDPGEPGIGNVRVVLYNCNGDSLDQQYTDGNGNYLFTNLAAGGYYVIFKDIPAGYSFSGQDQGGNDSADSDANSNGQTACVMLPPGGSNLTVDGGIKPDRVKVCEAEDFAASGHGLLFTSGTYPGTDNRYGFDSNGGEFITYANGTARLTGMLVNKSDANLKLCVELRMIKRKDWGAWSAQGGLAKGSHLGPYMTWDYYEVDSLNSFLIGKGNLAGEVFSLSHMPVNRVYGPQVGTGANDRNANYGMSGWWFFNSVSGNYGGTGDFNLNLDNCVNHTTAPAPPQLGAMALLQGPYEPTTGLMRTDLKTQGILPGTQPFNTAPWNYTGTETLGTTAPDSVVDWALIELRDVNNPETVLSRQAGVLVRNGQLVQADGFSLIELPQNTSNFYLVIYNWNHLSVMSSQPLQKYGNVYYHDFTAGISSIYEDLSLPNQPAVVLPGGKTLLFEGDATSDELINSLDLGQVLQYYFNTGISSKDVNMDGVVNSIDLGRTMQNYFKRSHVPR